MLKLTRRELEVARLAAKGWDNALVAAALGVAPRTVKNHLQSAFRKLNVKDRVQLALQADRLSDPPR